MPTHDSSDATRFKSAAQQSDDVSSPPARPSEGSGRDAKPDTPHFLANPDHTDKIILGYLLVLTILSFTLMPLRVWLLNWPVVYALLVGGYTSAIVGGATSTVGGTAAWIVVACSLVGALKAVPAWWIVGRKWGVEYLQILIGKSKRNSRITGFLQGLHPALLLVVMFLSYIPFVSLLVFALVLSGINKIRFRWVLLVNVAGILVRNSFFAYLGIRYGESVVHVVDQINRYSFWITLALVIVAIVAAKCKQARMG